MSERYQPIVDLSIAPNGIYHTYGIAERDGVFTVTPHRELLGYDISRLVDRSAPPLDDQTRMLYDAVKSLSTQFTSVSILPHELEIEGPYRLVRNRYRGDWPVDLSLDWEVVECIASYLGWSESPQMRVRRQTVREIEIMMDDNIISAIGLGLKPPRGWPYGELGF